MDSPAESLGMKEMAGLGTVALIRWRIAGIGGEIAG